MVDLEQRDTSAEDLTCCHNQVEKSRVISRFHIRTMRERGGTERGHRKLDRQASAYIIYIYIPF